jgi:flagellar assembly factor FliW
MNEILDSTEILPLPPQLHFIKEGPLGFEKLTSFQLEAYAAETPFYWLRAIADPELAFLVMEPGYFIEDYAFELSDETLNALQVTQASEIGVLVLLTVPENPLEMTANLLGPIVFHRQHHHCKQVVLDAETYPLQYPVLLEALNARTDA